MQFSYFYVENANLIKIMLKKGNLLI